ncbi:MAG: J domain-containing protein [Clostridia bacterium]|nr:J domain-containing protein [Clostridia bacterium]
MNPYEVLGVSEGADEETIKKAYKELVKKYHPDKYVNNPLADLAAEKMKEINKAYDMLTKNKGDSAVHGSYTADGAYSSASGTYGDPRSYSGAKPTFGLVRQLISMGAYSHALMMLQQLPKTAEWYYLSGLIDMRRGWTTRGMENLRKACEMEPDNVEYRDQLRYNETNAGEYKTGSGGYTASGECCPLPCMCLPCICPGSCCCGC